MNTVRDFSLFRLSPSALPVRSGLRYFFFVCCLAWLGIPVAEAAAPRVQIADPYLELHTGPGRGFPVFHVVERGEWVTLLTRQTDWFRIQTDNGKEGWAARQQLERTLTEAGMPATFRDTLLADYISRRVEVGFSGGQLDGDTMLGAHIGYGFHKNLAAELTYSQAAGVFSSSSLVYVSLLSQPYPEWRVSPFFSLGIGRFRNVPKPTLVGGVETESNLANAGLGVRAYLTRNFIVRGDYRRHLVFASEARSIEYREISLGVSFFF